MYFPRNWEFGSALSKLRNNFGGGLNPPNPHSWYAPGIKYPLDLYLPCTYASKTWNASKTNEQQLSLFDKKGALMYFRSETREWNMVKMIQL
jgi:hypothetical protein